MSQGKRKQVDVLGVAGSLVGLPEAASPSKIPRVSGSFSGESSPNLASVVDVGSRKVTAELNQYSPGSAGSTWSGGIPETPAHLTLDFSDPSHLPKDVVGNLDALMEHIADLQQFIQQWVQITPAERAVHFSDPLEEERMSLWIMNALISLGEVYCRLQGLDPLRENLDKPKDLLSRYAFKFDELEPHSHLLSRAESGPNTRLDIPAVKRFLKAALPEQKLDQTDNSNNSSSGNTAPMNLDKE